MIEHCTLERDAQAVEQIFQRTFFGLALEKLKGARVKLFFYTWMQMQGIYLGM